jgi:hypothetical protein
VCVAVKSCTIYSSVSFRFLVGFGLDTSFVITHCVSFFPPLYFSLMFYLTLLDLPNLSLLMARCDIHVDSFLFPRRISDASSSFYPSSPLRCG